MDSYWNQFHVMFLNDLERDVISALWLFRIVKTDDKGLKQAFTVLSDRCLVSTLSSM